MLLKDCSSNVPTFESLGEDFIKDMKKNFKKYWKIFGGRTIVPINLEKINSFDPVYYCLVHGIGDTKGQYPIQEMRNHGFNKMAFSGKVRKFRQS